MRRARRGVAEIWSLKTYGLTASRRLLLAAERRDAGAPRAGGASAQADALSTAATTRFEIAAAPSAKSPAAAGRDLPGPFACSARLVKARAGTGAATAGTARRGATRSAGWRSEEKEPLTTRRFLSLWLPRLATDRARRRARR